MDIDAIERAAKAALGFGCQCGACVEARKELWENDVFRLCRLARAADVAIRPRRRR